MYRNFEGGRVVSNENLRGPLLPPGGFAARVGRPPPPAPWHRYWAKCGHVTDQIIVLGAVNEPDTAAAPSPSG